VCRNLILGLFEGS
jgi:hypothetical protein